MSSKLPTDSLVVASECDLDCLFCDRQRPKEVDDSPAEELLARKNPTGRALRITGCDPLRRRDLAGLIALAKRCGYKRVAVATNGVRLASPAVIGELCRAGLDEVVLTPYSTDPAVHDAITRRSGSHRLLSQALASLAEQPVDIRLRIPVLSSGVQDLHAILAYVLEHSSRVVGVELHVPKAIPPAPGVERFLPEAFSSLAEPLTRLFDLAAAHGIRCEILPRSGIPFCALPGPHRTVDVAPYHPETRALRDPGDRLGEGCAPCAMVEHCTGARVWHLARHGDADLKPLDQPLGFWQPPRMVKSETAAPRGAGRFRVVLVYLCEETWGYGPGASEYLRAQLLSTPELADRIDVELFFFVNEPVQKMVEEILASEPDLLAFTTYSWNLRSTGEVCRLLRRNQVAAPIVWGGVSFARFDREQDWFTWHDAVDAVAQGSGEYTLTELVRHLLAQQRPRRIAHALPGLYLVKDGEITHGGRARIPRTLDELASPYLFGTVYQVERPTIEMARGCQFSCTFCSDAKESREGRMLVHRVERLGREIAVIAGWPMSKWIDAGASTANVTDQALADVCAAIRLGDPAGKLQYGFQLYPSLASPAQREALSGINVGALHFGLQSLTPETFRPIKRGTNRRQLENALRTFEGLGPIEFSLLLGIPGETAESFQAVFDELLQYSEMRLIVNRLLILPGTELHLRRHEFGIEYDASRYYRVLKTATMSETELRRAQEHVIERANALPDLVRDGDARVRWVNFDQQESWGAPAEYGRPDLFSA